MKILLTMLSFFIFSSGTGQVRISGRVIDGQGKPVPGANVFLLDTYDGASSLGDGSFEFIATAVGKADLIAKFIGYRDFVQPVLLDAQSIVVEIRLEETISELKAVTITAGAFTANDASRRTIFKAADIASTAGATADIAGALNTLPGTQKIGELVT